MPLLLPSHCNASHPLPNFQHPNLLHRRRSNTKVVDVYEAHKRQLQNIPQWFSPKAVPVVFSSSTNDDDESDTLFVPTTRHSTVSTSDEEAIRSQLGYLPTNLLSVSARRGTTTAGTGTGTGTPLAFKTYPLNGGADRRKAKARGKLTPFPTLYWFCCPVVGKAIADLERRGFVAGLERRLRRSEGAADRFVRSHEEYARERWETLSQDHRDMLEKNLEGTNDRMRDMVRYSGIAGTDYESFVGGGGEGDANVDKRTKPSIKCLHAHYAHYRSQISRTGYRDKDEFINIVGEWTHLVLQEEFPDLIL